MLEELAELMAGGLSLTLGETLHGGYLLPEQPDGCNAIIERRGQEVDWDTTRQREFRFQVLTRGATARACRTEAERVFEWLIAQRGIELDSWERCFVLGAGGPGDIGQDENGRFLVSANIVVKAEKKE